VSPPILFHLGLVQMSLIPRGRWCSGVGRSPRAPCVVVTDLAPFPCWVQVGASQPPIRGHPAGTGPNRCKRNLTAPTGPCHAAAVSDPSIEQVTSAGRRLEVVVAGPGYAGSDADPGRSDADAAGDVSAILGHLGVDRFATLGWSGGGPHALAWAALLPERCRAAATMAGVAPWEADGLDWLADQGEENQAELAAALHGEAELTAWLEPVAAHLGAVTAADVSEALGDLVTDVDRRSLTGEFAEWAAASFRATMGTGVAGWRDDNPHSLHRGASSSPASPSRWRSGRATKPHGAGRARPLAGRACGRSDRAAPPRARPPVDRRRLDRPDRRRTRCERRLRPAATRTCPLPRNRHAACTRTARAGRSWPSTGPAADGQSHRARRSRRQRSRPTRRCTVTTELMRAPTTTRRPSRQPSRRPAGLPKPPTGR